MSFADALAQNRPPARIGDVRFVYQSSLLIGEPLGPRSSIAAAPEALFVAGFGAAAGCIAVLALPSDDATVPLAFGMGIGAVVSIGAAILLDRRRRARRSFVLNFATEVLRLEWAEPTGRPQLAAVPFDDVTDVEIIERPHSRLGIRLEFRARKPRGVVRRVVLIDRVPPAQGDELRRTLRLLRGAFGLRSTSEASLLGEPPASKRPWIE